MQSETRFYKEYMPVLKEKECMYLIKQAKSMHLKTLNYLAFTIEILLIIVIKDNFSNGD